MQFVRPNGKFWPYAAIVSATMIFPFSSGSAQNPPNKAPVPKILKVDKRAQSQAKTQAVETPQQPPVPQPRPESAEPSSDAAEPATPPPASVPVPELRPAISGSEEPETPPAPAEPALASAEDPAPPAKLELPSAEEIACRTRLRLLGAVFKEAEPVLGQNGCLMPHPVEMSKMTDKIEIAPGVVLNCGMAEAAARFMRDVASPAAKAELGAEVKSIAQASGFVCRPRNGTTKLSEHAFGNALDIASFTLTSGTVVAVEPAPPPKNEKFLRAVRAAACGPFKTVLGPGSNADHAEHLHFDLAARRNGGTYCK